MRDQEMIENNRGLYEPIHFIRAHSKDNNKSDIQTEVWKCAFEPDLKKPGQFTSLLATCGGNSVCVTDVRTAAVKYKFNADITELFFALAWGTAFSHSAYQLLAAGGSQKRIYFINPTDKIVEAASILSHNKEKKRGFKTRTAINSLIFHPTQLDILFCGVLSLENEILITRFSLTNLTDLKILHRLYCPSDVIQLTFQPTSKTLFCAHNEGLHAWKLSENLSNLDDERRTGVAVSLPLTPVVVNERKQVVQPDDMVDTVLSLAGTSWVAYKSIRSGHITIFDAASANVKNNQLKLNSYQFLRWADTYTAYLSIGWEPERKIISCGDDDGAVWLYKLEKMEHDANNVVVEPHAVLPWPKNLRDVHVEKERKLRIGTYDIPVSEVAMNGDYLAAVTRTNLICIWKENDSNEMEVDDLSD